MKNDSMYIYLLDIKAIVAIETYELMFTLRSL